MKKAQRLASTTYLRSWKSLSRMRMGEKNGKKLQDGTSDHYPPIHYKLHYFIFNTLSLFINIVFLSQYESSI